MSDVTADKLKIKDKYFIRIRVLNNFCAQVAADDGTKVLLIRFLVASIFVQHVWHASLGLSRDNFMPEFLGLNDLPTFAQHLIPVQVDLQINYMQLTGILIKFKSF